MCSRFSGGWFNRHVHDRRPEEILQRDEEAWF